MLTYLKRHPHWKLYLVSFAVPILIFASYFAFRKIYPIGSYSVLTSDLGQEYIDFFSFLKHNLFHDPGKFIFSLNKGLGGSFLGTIAYYLASPLNLLLLLFSDKLLPTGVFILILTKIGLISVTSTYFFKHTFQLKNYWAFLLGVSFALSGFVIDFQLCLMWLDSVILLPLLLTQLHQLVNVKAPATKLKRQLLLTFVLIWLTNFYTGYMVVLFGFLYFIYLLIVTKQSFKLLWLYFKNAVFGGLLNAWLLVPTALELLQGKVEQAKIDFNWDFSFPLQNLFAKFISGSFTFKEMSYGMPNFYFGSILLVLLLTFFLNRQISRKEKLCAFIMLSLLFVSLAYNPLILLWHLGQYPVWFPGRFSFVFSLFCLILVARSLQADFWQQKFNWKIIVTCIGLLITLNWANARNLPFLNNDKIWLTAAFLVVGFLLLMLRKQNFKYGPALVIVLVLLDLTVNLVGSLADISYQENAGFVAYQQQVSQSIKTIKQQDDSLYRVEKTFFRDNDDPLSNDFYGVSQFNSVIEQNQVNTINNLGMTNNENSFNYSFPTIVTDSLLGIKYYLTANQSYDGPLKPAVFTNLAYRPDLNNYQLIDNQSPIKIYRNPYTLPFSYLVDQKLPKLLKSNTARMNQEAILQKLMPSQQPYFTESSLQLQNLNNLKPNNPTNPHSYQVIKKNQPGILTYEFTPLTNDSYYLSVPNTFNKDFVTIKVNGQQIRNDEMANSPKLINVGSNNLGQKISVTLETTNIIDVTQVYLYQFNLQNFKNNIKKIQATAPKLRQVNNFTFATESFKTTKKEILMTQLPTFKYSGQYRVTDNGKEVKTSTWDGLFLTVPVTKGAHRIKITYQPTSLYLGLLISLICCLLLVIHHYFKKFKNKA